MTRIQRLLSLTHPGILRSFAWPDDLAPFAQYNVIYGWNGTGKTTISELLRQLEKRATPPESTGALEVDHTPLPFDRFPQSDLPIRVFNRDYASETVFPVGGGDLPLIVVLGKEDVDRRKALDELTASIARLEQDQQQREAEANAANESLDSFCVQLAKSIKDALTSPGAGPFNTFNKSNYRSRVDEMLKASAHAAWLLADEEVAATRIACEAKAMPALPLPVELFSDVTPLHHMVTAILQQVVTATVIDELRADAALSRWTREGLELHRQREARSCLFCHGEIPDARLDALTQHFNSAFEMFLSQVDGARAECTRLSRAIRESLSFSDVARVHDTLRAEYSAAVSTASAEGNRLLGCLGQYEYALANKREAPFVRLNLEIRSPDMAHDVLQRVRGLVERHNDVSMKADEARSFARERLANHMIAESAALYMSLAAAAQEAENRLHEATQALCERHAAARELSDHIAAHVRPAEQLNSDLRNYLGHDELTLVPSDRGYRVERGGAKAHPLSEGEKTALALLFFLKSLDDSTFDRKSAVVVIDDPITSLDSRNLFSAFAFIKQRTSDVRQVFILTHSHPLLRQVVNWFRHLNGPKLEDKKLSRPASDPNPPKARYFVLEQIPGGSPRKSTLKQMDDALRKWNSEYQYLFSRVYCAAHGGASLSIENAYPLPNVARRVLEMFLAFRRPQDSGNFADGLQSLNCDPVITSRVLRFLHSFSHGDAIDEGSHDASCLTEATAVMADVLALIGEADPGHYDAMVEICNPGAGSSSSP
jgi:wobble nucleotide-excising tRNase